MNGDVSRNMAQSSEDFLRIVWPAIGTGFGQPIPVESVTATSFAKELDVRAGIDAWLICDDGIMRGLASRVQWTRNYNTFTIRIRSRLGGPTEYHKRSREIATSGSITPYYFTQGYVSQDHTHLVGAAIARMEDVIAAVKDRRGWEMPRNPDGSQGYAVSWASLQKDGAWVSVWKPPPPPGTWTQESLL